MAATNLLVRHVATASGNRDAFFVEALTSTSYSTMMATRVIRLSVLGRLQTCAG